MLQEQNQTEFKTDESGNVLDDYKNRIVEVIERERYQVIQMANEEASEIIAQAREESARIIETAHESAEQVLADSRERGEHDGRDERDRIIGEAYKEAEQIMRQARTATEEELKTRREALREGAQREALVIRDKAIQKAEREGKTIISDAREKAAAIKKEAEDKARKQAKRRTSREVERIISIAQQKATQIIEAARCISQYEADRLIPEGLKKAGISEVEVRETVSKDDTKMSTSISNEPPEGVAEPMVAHVQIEAESSLEQVYAEPESDSEYQVPPEASAVTSQKAAVDQGATEDNTILSEPESTAPMGNAPELFEGKLGLEVTPRVSYTIMGEFKRWLRFNPNITIETADKAVTDGSVVTLNLLKPTPIIDLLTCIPIVEYAEKGNGSVHVVLRAG